jgi:hypothetical protein
MPCLKSPGGYLENSGGSHFSGDGRGPRCWLAQGHAFPLGKSANLHCAQTLPTFALDFSNLGLSSILSHLGGPSFPSLLFDFSVSLVQTFASFFSIRSHSRSKSHNDGVSRRILALPSDELQHLRSVIRPCYFSGFFTATIRVTDSF